MSNLLRKLGKWKVMVPSPPRLLDKGPYWTRGAGGYKNRGCFGTHQTPNLLTTPAPLQMELTCN